MFLLLRVFDSNLGLALETRQLARYLPAADEAVESLAAVSTRLRRRLAVARDPQRQSRALRKYSRSLDAMLVDLRVLRPPPILVPSHRAQVTRLRSARNLALRLRSAVNDRDEQRVARLLVRFRRASGRRGRERSRSDRALRAYNRRYRALIELSRDLQRERRRLERAFE